MDRATKGFFSYRSSFPLKNRIALTTGDPLGIGQKITAQALSRLGPKKGFQYLVWTKDTSPTLNLPKFKTKVFKTSFQALKSPFQENYILQIKSHGGPGDHLEDAGTLCLKQKISALLTGPASKVSIKKHRYQALGQTALLKILCQKKNVFMCFRGHFFNIILLTDHIPLKQVSIKKNTFKECVSLALQSREFLPPSLQKKPLGVLALNPHAGEGGLIGKEEEHLKDFLQEFPSEKVRGPLVPDAAFLTKNWKLYSFFIALYHDQGLIPFKMIHSHKGFVQTLGLPFLRLGVDHGIGIGLKDKEISSESFFNGLKEAMKMIRHSLRKT